MLEHEHLNNWNIFLTAAKIGNTVAQVTDIEKSKDVFLRLEPTLPRNKQFAMLNIPYPLIDPFSRYFKVPFTKIPFKVDSLPKPFLGEILEVKENDNIREALIAIPLALFNNSSFRDYLSKFNKVKIKMTPVSYIYVTAAAGHPLYNYLDKGNKVYSKFDLLSNGTILTRIGKAGTSYQYLEILESSLDINKYVETYLVSPYKRRIKEITEVFLGHKDADSVIFHGINISSGFSNIFTGDILFEVDFRTEMDLQNTPKKEVLELSTYKENIDLSRKLMLQLSNAEEDYSVTLPSGLIIKKDRVEYAGQELYSSITTPEDFLFNSREYFPIFAVSDNKPEYIYRPLLGSMKIEDLNWDNYLGSFIQYNWLKGPQFERIDLKIGTVDVKLEYRKNSNLFYINDKRINKDEVPHVLTKALCCLESEDFNKTVGIISKTSLEMHKFISEGLIFKLNMSSMNDPMKQQLAQYIKYSDIEISFRIVRIKNLNYIELNDDKLVQIKDSRTLMDLRGQVVSFTRMKELFGKDTKVLSEEVDIDVDTKGIVEKARQRYLDAFKKSVQLLNDAVDNLGAEKIKNWENMQGIRVQGSSGSQYFIQVENMDNPMEKESSCTVYHYPSKNHICIVDKSGGHMAGVDRVVARMYALKNDSVLAEHIHTLKNYVK